MFLTLVYILQFKVKTNLYKGLKTFKKYSKKRK